MKVSAKVAVLLALTIAAYAQPRKFSLAYQLTHSDIGEPFPSPDGKKIVYDMVISGAEQIFIMNSDGTGQTQITHDPWDHDTPSWSPDGKKIAFTATSKSRDIIYVMNVDGTAQERITDDSHNYIHPNWSADSKRLIFCSNDDLHPPKKNESEIYVFDMASRTMSVLISGGTNTYPSWSPDGTKLTFRRMIGDMNSEVFVANADGSDQKNVTNHMAFDGWPAWSPDGTQIAFSSNRNANYQIFLMKPDGTDVHLLANTEGRATEPRWSPDSKTVYFTICKKVDFGVDCQIHAAPVPERPAPQ